VVGGALRFRRAWLPALHLDEMVARERGLPSPHDTLAFCISGGQSCPRSIARHGCGLGARTAKSARYARVSHSERAWLPALHLCEMVAARGASVFAGLRPDKVPPPCHDQVCWWSCGRLYFRRKDARHGLVAVFAIDREISAIQGEDHGCALEFSHTHQTGIRQIHIAVLIFAE